MERKKVSIKDFNKAISKIAKAPVKKKEVKQPPKKNKNVR